jgi:hypothetical protein
MNQMKTKFLIPAMIALMSVSASAWADKPDGDGTVTMRLMGEADAELPGVVTNPIELPSHLLGDTEDADKLERAKKALEDATANRNNGREHGLSHAEQAREQAQNMSENAKSNRENRGRGEDNRPERPEPPGPPETPPGRP